MSCARLPVCKIPSSISPGGNLKLLTLSGINQLISHNSYNSETVWYNRYPLRLVLDFDNVHLGPVNVEVKTTLDRLHFLEAEPFQLYFRRVPTTPPYSFQLHFERVFCNIDTIKLIQSHTFIQINKSKVLSDQQFRAIPLPNSSHKSTGPHIAYLHDQSLLPLCVPTKNQLQDGIIVYTTYKTLLDSNKRADLIIQDDSSIRRFELNKPDDYTIEFPGEAISCEYIQICETVKHIIISDAKSTTPRLWAEYGA